MTTKLESIDTPDPSMEKVIEALKSGKKMGAIMICTERGNKCTAPSCAFAE